MQESLEETTSLNFVKTRGKHALQRAGFRKLFHCRHFRGRQVQEPFVLFLQEFWIKTEDSIDQQSRRPLIGHVCRAIVVDEHCQAFYGKSTAPSPFQWARYPDQAGQQDACSTERSFNDQQYLNKWRLTAGGRSETAKYFARRSQCASNPWPNTGKRWAPPTNR